MLNVLRFLLNVISALYFVGLFWYFYDDGLAWLVNIEILGHVHGFLWVISMVFLVSLDAVVSSKIRGIESRRHTILTAEIPRR